MGTFRRNELHPARSGIQGRLRIHRLARDQFAEQRPECPRQKNVRAFKPGKPITANLTLQAQYRQTKGYTVTLDAGEGNHIEGLTNQTLTRMTTPEGKMASYPSAESPSSKTYFEGWYTEDDRRVDNDKDYVFKKDTVLYAHWSTSAVITFK